MKLGLPDPKPPHSISHRSATVSTSEQLVIHHVVTIYLPARPSALLAAPYPQRDKTKRDLQ